MPPQAASQPAPSAASAARRSKVIKPFSHAAIGAAELFDLRHEASREFDRKSRDLQVVTPNGSSDRRMRVRVGTADRSARHRSVRRSVSAGGRVLQYNR
jgi:hypothetical protein